MRKRCGYCDNLCRTRHSCAVKVRPILPCSLPHQQFFSPTAPSLLPACSQPALYLECGKLTQRRRSRFRLGLLRHRTGMSLAQAWCSWVLAFAGLALTACTGRLALVCCDATALLPHEPVGFLLRLLTSQRSRDRPFTVHGTQLEMMPPGPHPSLADNGARRAARTF